MQKIKKSVKMVNVTAKDIKNGCPQRADSCPITLAVKRLLKTDNDVETSDVIEVFGKSGGSEFYRVPKKATNFILRFDEGKPVKPFKFRLVKNY